MIIVFEPGTIHVSKMGAVTGVVYFDFGADRQFPIARWNDFVIVVASWWLSAVRKLSREHQETELRFMDGPYWITLIVQGDSRLLLRCIEDRRGAGIAYEVVVGVEELERELLKFAREVLGACSSAGIETADLDDLRRSLGG